jgi:hypothetical protein
MLKLKHLLKKALLHFFSKLFNKDILQIKNCDYICSGYLFIIYVYLYIHI